MTAHLPVSNPTRAEKRSHRLFARDHWQGHLRDFHLDFADLYGQGQVIGLASRQASLDRFSYIFDCRHLGCALRNTSRQGGALRHNHASFVSFERDEQSHAFILAQSAKLARKVSGGRVGC